ncbi:MAG: FAD:protein FMN transferase [Bacteriovoracales bacterium]
MGTYWSIDLSDPGVSFPREYLSQKIIGLVDLYDKTFSDWREDSELKALEKNLTQFQKPTDLFIKGLEYSKLGYDKSNGEFDITVGAILWNEKKEKVGFDKLELNGNKFRFKEDPKRLTFGGIAKGMAVGALSTWLYKNNIKNFRVNAGDGNLSFIGKNFKEAWIEEKQTGPTNPQEIIFLSRSNIKQNGRVHIIGIKRGADSVKISCRSKAKDLLDWEKIGALSDAYSTALVLESNLDWSKFGCRNLTKD